MSLEFPVLRLGLVGFSIDQQEHLGNLLKTRIVVRWQPWPFADADAWWVNGAHAQRMANGIVRIPAADPKRRSTLLNLSEVDRPMAFAQPLAIADVGSSATFDPAEPESVVAILRAFEIRLQPAAVQFTLASAIGSMQRARGSAVYHVALAGKLVAVVDLRGQVGHSATVQPAELERADWNGRPAAAALIPGHFVQASISEVMWRYAVRTTREVLPVRYLTSRIYFRRPPRVPGRLLKDTHLALVRELAAAPGTFEELQQRTGLGREGLVQALTALYFSGSVTASEKRASSNGATSGSLAPSSIGPSILQSDLRDISPSGGDRPSDHTAPAPLRPSE